MKKITAPVLCLAISLLCPSVRAQDTGYFSEVPTADRVVQDMQAAGPRESAARAAAALFALQTPIRWQAAGTGVFKLHEAKRLAEFERVSKVLMAEEEAKYPPCSGDDCDRYKLHRCQAAYMFSPEFYREVFDRYFSPQWQSRYTGKETTGIWGQALALPAGTKGIAKVSTAAADICGETPIVPRAPAPPAVSQRQTPAASPSASGTVVPAAAAAYYNQGEGYAKAQDHAKALEAHKKALAIKPDFPEGLLRLGTAHTLLRQYAEAAAALELSLRLKPYPQTHFILGSAYVSLKQYDKAVPQFRESIRLQPDDVEANYLLGLTHYALKHYHEALEAVQRAVRLKPDFSVAYFNLGVTHLAAGQKDQALMLHEKLHTLDQAWAQNLEQEINKPR